MKKAISACGGRSGRSTRPCARELEHLRPGRAGAAQQVRPVRLHLRGGVDREGPLAALPGVARIGLADAAAGELGALGFAAGDVERGEAALAR